MPVLKIKKEDGTWEVVTGSSNVEIDPSLEIEGMAADAKAVGDAINDLSTDIAEAGAIDIDLGGSNSGEANTINADTLGGKHESELSVANAINADSLGGILAEEYVKLSDLENLDTSGISMELLWENASPTSVFAAQTVTLNGEYDLYKIFFYGLNGSDLQVIDVVPNELFTFSYVRTYGKYKASGREITWDNGNMVFSVGNYAASKSVEPSVQSDVAVPVKIYGIKGIKGVST